MVEVYDNYEGDTYTAELWSITTGTCIARPFAEFHFRTLLRDSTSARSPINLELGELCVRNRYSIAWDLCSWYA
jgi:hypothetical protein